MYISPSVLQETGLTGSGLAATIIIKACNIIEWLTFFSSPYDV
jgi:hypothetical protein